MKILEISNFNTPQKKTQKNSKKSTVKFKILKTHEALRARQPHHDTTRDDCIFFLFSTFTMTSLNVRCFTATYWVEVCISVMSVIASLTLTTKVLLWFLLVVLQERSSRIRKRP